MIDPGSCVEAFEHTVRLIELSVSNTSASPIDIAMGEMVEAVTESWKFTFEAVENFINDPTPENHVTLRTILETGCPKLQEQLRTIVNQF